MQKITPFLWFDRNAEEGVNFYASVFENAKVGSITRYDEAAAKASGQPEGSAMTVSFTIGGQEFVALNGGPVFKPSPAISFFVNCKTENEVIELWNKLSGGSILMPLDRYPFSDKYGWLQDKYGISWQIILSQGEIKQKIVPSLMFVGNVCGKADEAIHFYTSIFHNSKVGSIYRYGASNPHDKEENIMFADFNLDGQWFAAMDSAYEHKFSFNEAISFAINCKDQNEVDYYWDKLSEGGDEKAQQCGWLKDKYGVSWQVVPVQMIQMLGDKNATKAKRVMEAMIQMKKIDLPTLQKAYDEQ